VGGRIRFPEKECRVATHLVESRLPWEEGDSDKF